MTAAGRTIVACWWQSGYSATETAIGGTSKNLSTKVQFSAELRARWLIQYKSTDKV